MSTENNETQQSDQNQPTSQGQSQQEAPSQTSQNQPQPEAQAQNQASSDEEPTSKTDTGNTRHTQTAESQQRSNGRDLARANGGVTATTDRSSRSPEPSEVFDPGAATRVGLLRLGQHCQESGSIYGAIYAYTKVLERYPGRGAASAAVEELVLMANDLMDHHKF